MKMNFQLPVMAVLLSVSSLSHATLTSTAGPIHFSGSASVSASQSYPNTPGGTGPLNVTNTNNGAMAANVSLGKFDVTTGVLTAADAQVTSDRRQTISGSGYKGNGAGKTMSGSGTSSAAISAIGAFQNLSPIISQPGGSCSLATGGTGSINCSWGPTTSAATTTNGSVIVNSANLNDYVGSSGTINAALTLPSLSVTDTQSTNQGQASGSSATYVVNWSGTVQANYSYLLHADGSFNGLSDLNTLTLDFGTVLQGSSVSPLAFNIYNLADSNRAGLDLDSISSGTGDVTKLTTNMVGFTNLAQGGTNGFNALLETSSAGLFNAQYILNLSDEDIGASNTRLAQQLTLNLIGNVTAVPLPGALWLFGSVLMGGLAIGRRKQII